MKSVLVAIDFSEPTDELLLHAAQLARCQELAVRLVHVASPEMQLLTPSPVPAPVEVPDAEDRISARDRLTHYAMDLRAQGLDAHATLTEGAPVARILEIAEAYQAAVIIMGTHGHGLIYDALVGSVSEGVVRRATVPVLLVPPAARRQS